MKKRKLLLIIAFITVASLIYYQFMRENHNSSETTLLKAFDASGAKIVSSEIYFWGHLGPMYKDWDSIQVLAQKLVYDLNIKNDGQYSKRIVENDWLKRIEYSGVDSKNRVSKVIAQINNKTGDTYEKYITLSVTEDLSASTLGDTRGDVVKILNSYEIKPTVSSCITGSFESKLSSNRINSICDKIFKSAEAKKIEGLNSEKLVSVSAYSPFINDNIKVNGKRVNMNLAMRYNTLEDKTYIWLGTPVINTEY